MLDGSAVAKVLNWLWSQNPEVVNRSEDDGISVHDHIVSIKYVYFLSNPAKHKNLSTNRVFNDSCQILWSGKVMNNGFNNQQSVQLIAPSLSSKQHNLGSWCHPKPPKDKVVGIEMTSFEVRHLL
jgi:hypothetical protein